MRIKGKFKIINGQIKHLDRFLELVEKLKSNPEYEGKSGYVSIDMNELPIRDAQRAYYWGYLIKEIANKAFDGEQDRAHIEVKRKFVFHRVGSIEEIPEKHYNRAILEYDLIQDGRPMRIFRTMYYPGFSTPVISTEIHLSLVGYIQSMSTMTLKEAAEFMRMVEVWSVDFLQIPIGDDAPHVRTDAVKVK